MIRFYPNLFAEILKAKKDNGLRYYLWAKSYDVGNKGWMTKVDFIACLMEMGKTKRTCQDIMYRWNTIFWTIEDKRVWFISIKKLMLQYDVTLDHTCSISKESLLDLITFRATIEASLFSHKTNKFVDKTLKPDGEVIISRATIKDRIGKSKYSQRKYEKHLGIKVKSNYSEVKPDPFHYPILDITGNLHPRVRWFNHKMYIRIPNSYSYAFEEAGKVKLEGHPIGNHFYLFSYPAGQLYFSSPQEVRRVSNSYHLLSRRYKKCNLYTYVNTNPDIWGSVEG